MAVRAVRERLVQDLGGWLVDGLVSKETHTLLRQRYEAERFGFGQAIKYLGIAGGLLAFFGLLGLVGAVADSEAVNAFLLLMVGAALTSAGIKLSIDQLGRYGFSSKVVLALGLVAMTLGFGLAVELFGLSERSVVVVTGALVLPAVGFLAYRFGNIFLLVMGLLGLFYWIGSWTSMLGRSSYAMFIEDPRLMSMAAIGGVGLGVYHELHLRERTGRFFQAYEAIGLIYLNVSLLIMSSEHQGRWELGILWILLFAVAAIGQIVLGARLHNGLFTGFGVTALGLNIYTRYFEYFWERTSAGIFFLLGGLSLFGVGVACELILKRYRRGIA